MKYQKHAIILTIVALSAIAFLTRVLCIENLTVDYGINLLGNDPWYSLRQIELTLANFPAYANFDPMTFYPRGDIIHWGPMLTWICSFLCIIFGAVTRPEIMYISSFIPPLFAAAMVPATYYVGYKLKDEKTGIIAALFITFVGGQYFYRSLFGFIDHHITEVFFGTLFCILYIIAIEYKEFNKNCIIVSVIAGIVYFLGLLNMPTMVLYAFIVALYTYASTIIFGYGKDKYKLAMVNLTTFGVITILLVIFGIFGGFNTSTFALNRYGIGHIAIYLGIIASTFILYKVPEYIKSRNITLVLTGFIIFVTFIVNYVMKTIWWGAVLSFFGSMSYSQTVQEASAWSMESMVATYGLGSLLFIIGIVLLVIEIYRNNNREIGLFVLIWSLVMFISTWQHVRYEYYFAANIAIISAYLVGMAISTLTKYDIALLLGKEVAEEESKEHLSRKEKKKQSKKKVKTSQSAAKKNKASPLKILIVGVIIIFSLSFVGVSAMNNIAFSTNTGGGMEPDWHEALVWLKENSPDTGIDYYTIYDENSFEYPEESYGVMSWWDYGHWITTIANRIPNANPFQHGVIGMDGNSTAGSAGFFIKTEEEEIEKMADRLGIKYVITDMAMATGKFWAMAKWYDPEFNYVDPYFINAYVYTGTGWQPNIFYNPEYYNTIVARMHMFDGTEIEPEMIYAGKFEVKDNYLRLEDIQQISTEDKEKYENDGYFVTGTYPFESITNLPSLQHYRLVFESSNSAAYGNGIDVKGVKIFERVKGARIQEKGIVTINIVTNTGREFVYKQTNKDGDMLIIPYSTENAKIIFTTEDGMIFNEEIEITEKEVQNGLDITYKLFL